MCFRSTFCWTACWAVGFAAWASAEPAGRETALQIGHAVGVKAIAFHPDGKRIATGGDDDSVILWELASGRQLRTLRGGPLGNGYEVLASLKGLKLPDSFPVGATARASVESIQFTPDGSRMLVVCAPKGLRDLMLACCVATIWDPVAGRLLRRIEVGQEIDTLALSPDGKMLFGAGWSMSAEEAQDMVATGIPFSADTPASIWDVPSGRKVKQFHSREWDIASGQFAADGRSVISVCTDRKGANRMQRGPTANAPSPPEQLPPARVVVWDVATAKPTRQFPLTRGMTQLRLAGSGNRLLAWNPHQRELPIEVWDLPAGKRLYSVPGAIPACSKDADCWIARDADGHLRTYRLADGKALGKLAGPLQEAACLALSGDGKQAAAGILNRLAMEPNKGASARGTPGEAQVFDLARGVQVATLACRQDPLDALAVSPGGRYLAIGGQLWDTRAGTPLIALCDTPAQCLNATFAPDEQRVAVSNHQTAPMFDLFPPGAASAEPATILARELELPAGRERQRFATAERVYERVELTYDPSGKRLMTLTTRGSIMLWDTQQGRKLAQSALHGNRMTLVAAPSTKLVAAFYEFEHVVWWDLQSGKETPADGRKTPTAMQGSTPSAMSSDGKRTLDINDDASAVVFTDSDRPGTRLTLKPRLEKGAVVSKVGFDEQNARFAFTKLNTLRNALFDPASGKELRRLQPAELQLTVAAFAPDEKHVAASGDEGKVAIWSVADGKLVEELPCPSPVTALGYRADAKCLAVGCADHSVMVTQLGSKSTTVLRGHEGAVDSVAFAAEARLLVTVSSQDATARLWNAASGQELARVISLNGRADWLVITPDGFYDGSPAGRQAVMYRTAGSELLAAEQAQPSRRRPGLLATLWRGDPVK